MKCDYPGCDGKGFIEYDAGLLQIGCVRCSGIGKVDEALTKEEFERAYAFRSDMTTDQVRELGLEAVEADVPEGWAMEKKAVATPEADPKMLETISIGGGIPEGMVVDSSTTTTKGTDSTYEEAEITGDGTGKALPEIDKSAYSKEGLNDNSDSRTGQANKPTGSGDTSQPKQPKKPKAKKKAAKKSG